MITHFGTLDTLKLKKSYRQRQAVNHQHGVFRVFVQNVFEKNDISNDTSLWLGQLFLCWGQSLGDTCYQRGRRKGVNSWLKVLEWLFIKRHINVRWHPQRTSYWPTGQGIGKPDKLESEGNGEVHQFWISEVLKRIVHYYIRRKEV